MSREFSDSTNKDGLYEKFQDLTHTNTTSYPIAKFTADANDTYARFMMLAMRASGKWEVDDTNHQSADSKYPIATTNLVSGQQDYSFINDGGTVANQILNIIRVECASSSSSGVDHVLDPYDQSEEEGSLTYNATITGVPHRYDKLASGIWLDAKPNFSATAGLKVWFQRTPIYFLTTDTTKKPGIPDMFHEYLFVRPAFQYSVINLPKLAPGYLNWMNQIEKDIGLFYADRNRDEHREITMREIRFM